MFYPSMRLVFVKKLLLGIVLTLETVLIKMIFLSETIFLSVSEEIPSRPDFVVYIRVFYIYN